MRHSVHSKFGHCRPKFRDFEKASCDQYRHRYRRIPQVGATGYIQNTNIGTTTNTDGLFVLDVTPEQAITISYIGYLSQTHVIHGLDVINVQLKADTDQIEEVVEGYGK
ncbi:carboxypeptidase-like regulatory domain-containing protein [uncultured Alistipes sp.]|uniref:carboxypeptidase-like regulatory domain-containing protein n=1 Tax=uncultured Alistipes sp. TaxID=538949 RepID=UPI003208656D